MSITMKTALCSAFAALATAHGTVSGIVADDVYSEGWQLSYYYQIQQGQAAPTTPGWYAEDLDNGFVSPDNYTSPDIICHKNAKQLATTDSATVKAGGTVDFEWTVWPDSHVGPVITYVANCGGECASVDKTELAWVKIDAGGYDVDTKTWASTKMIANNNTWSTKVPSTLKAGNYVFRHEIIALHSAGTENGAQNYPQCLNIAITGSGAESPEGTVGEKLYTSTDPGILVNVYGNLDSYTIPGPALFGSGGSDTGSGSGGSSASAAPASSTSTAAAPTTTAAPVATTSSAAASSSTSTEDSCEPDGEETTTAAAVPTTFKTMVSSATSVSAVAATTSAAASTPTATSGSGSGSNAAPGDYGSFTAWMKWIQGIGESELLN